MKAIVTRETAAELDGRCSAHQSGARCARAVELERITIYHPDGEVGLAELCSEHLASLQADSEMIGSRTTGALN